MMAEADIIRLQRQAAEGGAIPDPWTRRQMLAIAARAVGKIDHWGDRGLTAISKDELLAMAGALIALGLVAVPPDAPVPETLVVRGTTELNPTPSSQGDQP